MATIARCPGGHVFVVSRGCRKYCSQRCADEFGPRGPLHFHRPGCEQPREACGSWTRLVPRITTVPGDVECGNCKRTDAWKKAVAD